MEEHLPREIQLEAGVIVGHLRAAGWQVTAAAFDEKRFGNWYVELAKADRSIRLIKDRSQYMVDGPVAELKAAGLFGPFGDLNSFRDAVVAWTASRPRM